MAKDSLPESTSGYLMGFAALAMTPMILGAGWLGDRFDKGKLAALASLTRAVAWITLGLWPSFDVSQMMLVLLLRAPGESIWGPDLRPAGRSLRHPALRDPSRHLQHGDQHDGMRDAVVGRVDL